MVRGVAAAQYPLADILIDADGFPPLYALLMHAILPLLGDLAGRWMAVGLGAATIVVAYGIGREIEDHATGISMAAIVAIMPISVWFGQESRAYALLHLATAAALWSGIRLVQGEPTRKRWIIFCASLLIGFYTHYFFVFVATLLFVALSLYRPIEVRSLVAGKQWLAPLAITGLLMIPWLFLLRADFAVQVDWPDQTRFGWTSMGYTYFSFLSGYSLGPSLRQLHTLSTSAAVTSLLPWLTSAAIGGTLVLAGARNVWSHTRWLLPLLLAVPIVGLAGNMAGVGYQARYPTWCHLAVGLWLALLIRQPARPLYTRLGVSVLVLLSLVAIGDRRLDSRYQNTDMASVARYLEQHADLQDQPVFVVSGYLAPVLNHYVEADAEFVRLARHCPPDERTATFTKLYLEHAVPEKTFWLVYARSFHEDDRGEILALVLSQKDVEMVLEFAGGRLYRGKWDSVRD